jgi:hypothetical protein
MGKMTNRLFAIFLTGIIFFSSFEITKATAAGSDDLKGNWAESALRQWKENGLLSGYADGTYQPDRPISRGELMALINRSFNLKETASISFSDLKVGNWAYEQAAIAVKAGYVQGYKDGTIRADQLVRRDEAAAMIAKLLELQQGDTTVLKSFSDGAQLAEWSKPAVSALISKGIIKGFPDKTYRPKGNLTRAESVTILERSLSEIGNVTTIGSAGVFGPETGTETVKGNAVINHEGVTLQNMVIEGNLTLAKGIGEGDVFLNNVHVLGTLSVAGGGEHSVHLKNSVFIDIVVNKKDGTVRIVAEGATSVQSVTVQSPAIIEESDVSGSGFTDVKLADELTQGSVVTMLGIFENVSIEAHGIHVEFPKGYIRQLSLSQQSAQSELNIGEHADIAKLVLDAVVKFLGQGTIETAIVNDGGTGTTFEKPPISMGGTSPGTGEGTSGGSSGSGSGSGSGTTLPIKGIYQLSVVSSIYVAGDSELLPVDGSHRLLDESEGIWYPSEHLQNKSYIKPTFTFQPENGEYYNGLVKVTATAVSASDGRTANDIQLFAGGETPLPGPSQKPWVDVLKAGYGEPKSVSDLQTDLSALNIYKWFVIAKPGVYKFRLQVEDASTHTVITQSDEINVIVEAANLNELVFGDYILDQIDYKGNVTGTGFDPNHQLYQVHYPNTISPNPVIRATASNAYVSAAKYETWDRYHASETIMENKSDGSFYYALKTGEQSTIKFDVRTEHVTQDYYLNIWRYEDPVKDPAKLDETDIQVTMDSVAVSGLNNSVIVSVYGSVDGNDLLGSVNTPNSTQTQAPVNVSVSVLTLPVKGTLWISVYDPSTGVTTQRVAKAYDNTLLPQFTNVTGVTIRDATSLEISGAQDGWGYNGFAGANSGINLLLDSWYLYGGPIANYDFFIVRSSSTSKPLVYDEVKPSEKEILYRSSGYNHYSKLTEGYFQIIFYYWTGQPIGYIEYKIQP